MNAVVVECGRKEPVGKRPRLLDVVGNKQAETRGDGMT